MPENRDQQPTMHPAYGMLTPGLTWDPPSTLIAGEDLLARLYNAIH